MRNLRWLWALVLAVAVAPGSVLAQQAATVTGRVVSSNGTGVVAATVSMPALGVGTQTGADGTYRLTVPAARIRAGQLQITATRVGFQSQSLAVTLTPGATVTRNFQLGTDVLQLEEIVATGQGTTTTRERLASTVNTVRAEAIQESRETNVVAALAGKAPNVEVTSSSGDPGAGAYIRIRGAASVFGGTQPLFVVDGTPIDNSTNRIEAATAGTATTNRAADINPNDVERIEILKGAAATAIYGSRGANGVVLITTKSGAVGSTRFTYNFQYANDEVNRTVPLQQSFGQGFGTASRTSPFSWGPRLGPDAEIFDHANEVYRTGNRFENNLTLSGGSERTTYYLSAGRLNHQGVIVGPQDFNRNSVRLKGTHRFLEDLTVGGNFAYTQSAGDFVQQGSNISGIQLAALRTPPNFDNRQYIDPATGLHQSYRCRPGASCPGGNAFTNIGVSRGYDNPFWIANEISNQAEVGRSFGNITLDYNPIDWLTFRYVLGADYYSDERLTVFPKSSSDFPQGRLIRANFVNGEYTSNLTGTVQGQLRENIQGSLTLGQSLSQQNYRQNRVNGTQLIFGAEETDFAVKNVGDEYKYRVRTDGYFATTELSFWEQLTLNGTLRVDGSSTFGGGEGNNSTGDGGGGDNNAGQERSDEGLFGRGRFLYPGVGVAWVFTELPVFEGISSFLNFGKLRASFGVSGRQPPVFSNVNAFTTTTIGDGWISGINTLYRGQEGVVTDPTLGNNNIRPEKKSEFEVGLDLALLEQRVSLGVTYYDRRTTDAILDLPRAPSTGFTTFFDNVGKFDNSGWEATLDVTPVQTDRFAWTIGAQYGRNRSCVKELAGAETRFLGGFTGSTVSLVAPERNENDDITRCYPFGVHYGDDFIRFGRGSQDQNTKQEIDSKMAQFGAQIGDIYVGADGLPQSDPQSRVLGDPNSDWTASLRNTFTVLGNLRVSGLVDISRGAEYWNGTKGALYFFGTHMDTEPYHGDGVDLTYREYASRQGFKNNRVAGPGADKTVPFDVNWFTDNIGSGFTGPTAQFIEDAGFVKLRDISVSYTLNQPFVRRLGFGSMEIAVSGRNLKTWTDYTGIDPESNLLGQSTARGLDYFNNPQTRSYVFSVNLNR